MGNITGSLTGALLGVRLAGRKGRCLGSIAGGAAGLIVEVGHLVAISIRRRGQHMISSKAASATSWEIEEVGIRSCALNVAPGWFNGAIDTLRHVLAPLGSISSGVFRHDWVTARVRGPSGEVAYLVAKKCGDGNIVVEWGETILEADEAGIDVVKGCGMGVGSAWRRKAKGRGRTVRELLDGVQRMQATYNMIVDNCQDFARQMLAWHDAS